MGSVRAVFEQCQLSLSVHQQLLTSLRSIYCDSDDKQAFFDEFVRLLGYALVRSDKSAAVTATLDFAARFVRFLGESARPSPPTASVDSTETRLEDGKSATEEPDGVNGDDGASEVHPFFYQLADYLLARHRAASSTVRYRCCQLLNRMLVSLGEDAYLDDRLWNGVYEAMLERLQDTIAEVRVQAVQALARLQNPASRQCPVIAAYVFHLRCDPQPEVRRAVLQNLGGSAQTLAAVLERVSDINGSVRRQAFRFLAKVHIKSLTIEQRRAVLRVGLNDREPALVATVRCQLLTAWLRHLSGSVGDLLHCVNVARCQQLAEQLLNAVYTDMTPADLVEVVSPPGEWRHMLASQWLSDERALMWRVALQRLRALPSSAHTDAAIEKLSPDLSCTCQLLQQLLATAVAAAGGGGSDDSSCFVLLQLLQLVATLELWDEYGRRQLVQLLRQQLVTECLPLQLVAPLVRLLESLVPDTGERLTLLLEIIADLRAPLSQHHHHQQQQQQKLMTIEESTELPDQAVAHDSQLRRAQLRMRIIELNDQLETAVSGQQFDTAQQLKRQLAALKQQQQQLAAVQLPEHSCLNSAVDVAEAVGAGAAACDTDADAEPGEGECALRCDPATMSRCLQLVYELLQSEQLVTLGDQLRALADSLVVPAMQSEAPEVRCAAVHALGTLCLLNLKLARQHLPLLVQVSRVDESEVQLAAYRALFDQLLVHGPQQLLEERDGKQSAAAAAARVVEDTAAPTDDCCQQQITDLMTEMASLLNSQHLKLRGVGAEALCKLLLHGRVSSARLLERLVLLWYSPLSDGDPFLRNMLGVFFPAFAAGARDNQELLAEAMLPTLNTLMQAPLASPLIEVDVDDVARFFIQLTRNSMLSTAAAAGAPSAAAAGAAGDGGCVHETLAFRLLHALRDEPRFRLDSARRSLTRALSQLQLSEAAPSAVRQLQLLSEQLIAGADRLVGEDKLVLKQLDRFSAALRQLKCSEPADGDVTMGSDSKPVGCGDKRLATDAADKSPPSSRRLIDRSFRRSADLSDTLSRPAGGQQLLIGDTELLLQEQEEEHEQPTCHQAAVGDTMKRGACTPPARQHKLSRSRASASVPDRVVDESPEPPERPAVTARTRNTRQTARLPARATRRTADITPDSPEDSSDTVSVISATSSESAGSSVARSTRSRRR